MALSTIINVSSNSVSGTNFEDYLKSFWTMMHTGRGLTAEIGGQIAVNTNAVLATSGTDWYNAGYEYDGTAFLNFGDILNIPNGSSYTFACVFKTSATGARPMLARLFQSASFQGYTLRLVNGAVNWLLGDGVGFIQSQESTGGWNDGNYHLAIISGDGLGSVWMWVDNNKSTFTANVNASNSAKNFYIGSTQQRTTPNYFDGNIGIVYANIGGGQISDAQASQLYNATHFAINDNYDLTTVNNSTSATLDITPVGEDIVYVYNREGFDSYEVPSLSPTIISVSGDEVIGLNFNDYRKANLTSIYPLQDGTDKIGGFDLTAYNSPTQVSGVFGCGLNFVSSASQYLEADIYSLTHNAISGQLQDISISCWINTTTTDNSRIMGRQSRTAGNSVPYGYALSIDGTGKVSFIVGNGIVQARSESGTGFNDGNPHHIVGSLSGESSGWLLYLWVDGVPITPALINTNLTVWLNGDAFRIAARAYDASPLCFDGIIEMATVELGKVYSDAEVLELYKQTHFKINDNYDLATINSPTSATLDVTPSGGDIVYAYNIYGSDSYEIIISNNPPTNISLTSNFIDENQPIGTAVGTFSTTDPDIGDTFTYTLVSGTGDDDNASFAVSGDVLVSNEIFDKETKDLYHIRVRTTDAGGLWYELAGAINISNENETPTNIVLSNNTATEECDPPQLIGTFTSVDPDVGDTFTYTLVEGAGSTDNASFSVSGNTLYATECFDYETKQTYSIRVRSTDLAGLYVEVPFTINVINIDETLTINFIRSGSKIIDPDPISVKVEIISPNDLPILGFGLMPGSVGTIQSSGTNDLISVVNQYYIINIDRTGELIVSASAGN